MTIGLCSGNFAGPTVERDVSIGTRAKLLGGIRIGAGASVGANSVVVDGGAAPRHRSRSARSGRPATRGLERAY